MVRIVVAFDSFKGSLSSREAGEAFCEGLHEVSPAVDVVVLSIADGGEGIAEAVVESVGGYILHAHVHDPLGRNVVADYGVINGGATAVIGMAAASGITRLAPKERNPLRASSYGTGELILDAISRGCHDILLGLGGSATNDGGTGMLRALGFRFYDSRGEELTDTISILERVSAISKPKCLPALQGVNFVAAVDVDNPLLGERGATHIFARQKGADDAMIERMEGAMRHYAAVVDGICGEAISLRRGVGAAGGVGYAAAALLGAALRSGIDTLLDIVEFDRVVEGAQLVITGEGRIDAQTLMGKAPAGVLSRAKRCGVPCIAVGGSVDSRVLQSGSGFARIYQAMPETMTLEEAMQHDTALANIRAVGREVGAYIGVVKRA